MPGYMDRARQVESAIQGIPPEYRIPWYWRLWIWFRSIWPTKPVRGVGIIRELPPVVEGEAVTQMDLAMEYENYIDRLREMEPTSAAYQSTMESCRMMLRERINRGGPNEVEPMCPWCGVLMRLFQDPATPLWIGPDDDHHWECECGARLPSLAAPRDENVRATARANSERRERRNALRQVALAPSGFVITTDGTRTPLLDDRGRSVIESSREPEETIEPQFAGGSRKVEV